MTGTDTRDRLARHGVALLNATGRRDQPLSAGGSLHIRHMPDVPATHLEEPSNATEAIVVPAERWGQSCMQHV
jgi:hypothetical protein